jgi:hypothetical protein
MRQGSNTSTVRPELVEGQKMSPFDKLRANGDKK